MRVLSSYTNPAGKLILKMHDHDKQEDLVMSLEEFLSQFNNRNMSDLVFSVREVKKSRPRNSNWVEEDYMVYKYYVSRNDNWQESVFRIFDTYTDAREFAMKHKAVITEVQYEYADSQQVNDYREEAEASTI